MRNILIVGAGGFAGSVLRYLLGGAVVRWAGAPRLAAGTLAVNLTGCLVIGLLAGVELRRGAFAADTRLLLFTGLLGGFTTFSAFGLETQSLLRDQMTGAALLYVALSVAGGIAAVALGYRLAAG